MNSKTRQLCDKIRKKLVSKVTGKPEYKNVDEVCSDAVEMYHDQLKKQGLM